MLIFLSKWELFTSSYSLRSMYSVQTLCTVCNVWYARAQTHSHKHNPIAQLSNLHSCCQWIKFGERMQTLVGFCICIQKQRHAGTAPFSMVLNCMWKIVIFQIGSYGVRWMVFLDERNPRLSRSHCPFTNIYYLLLIAQSIYGDRTWHSRACVCVYTDNAIPVFFRTLPSARTVYRLAVIMRWLHEAFVLHSCNYAMSLYPDATTATVVILTVLHCLASVCNFGNSIKSWYGIYGWSFKLIGLCLFDDNNRE